jgi:DNA-directed RNA polymerase subunit L
MEMNVIDKDKNMMKIEVTGSNEATLYLLTQQLLSDENVKVATYSMPHPQLDKPILYLETSKGWPKTALKNAAAVLEQQFESGVKIMEKNAGSTSKSTKPSAKKAAPKGKAKAPAKKAPAKKAPSKSKKTAKK